MSTMLKRAAKMAAEERTPGFVLVCPSCGEQDVSVTLDLADLTTCHCSACEDDFAVHTAIAQLTDRLAQYVLLESWINMAADVLATAETE